MGQVGTFLLVAYVEVSAAVYRLGQDGRDGGCARRPLGAHLTCRLFPRWPSYGVRYQGDAVLRRGRSMDRGLLREGTLTAGRVGV